MERRQAEADLRESQRFIQSIADASPHPMYVFDLRKQRPVWASRQVASLLGYSPQEMVEVGGQPLFALMHPEDAATLPQKLARWDAAADGQVLETEYRLRHADGTWHWFVGHDMPFSRDADGRVDRIIGITQDITGRKNAEQALRSSEARLASVIAHSPGVAVQWYDRQGRVKLWNHASEEMFGYTTEEAMGRTLDQLIHTPDEFQLFLQALSDIERTQQSVHPTEYQFRRRGGEPGTCLSTIFRIPGDEQGDWFVCMDVDVTARKKVERELERRLAELDVLNRMGLICAEARDEDELFTQATALIARNLFSDNCGFVLMAPSGKELSPHRSFINTNPNADRGAIPIDKGVTGLVARTGKARRIGDVRLVPEYWQGDSRTRSELCIPVRVSGQVVGVLNVESDKLNAFSETDEKLFTTIVEMLGNALERLRAEAALRKSGHYLRTVLEAQPECLKLVSADGILLQMNAAGLAMIEACGTDSVIGEQVLNLVAPEHRERFLAMHRRVCGGASEVMEFEIIGLKGRRRWVESHAVPFRRSPDEPTMQLAITRDITERKRAEETLQRMRFSVDRAGDSVFWVSQEGRILYVNDAGCATRGYSRAEMLTMSVFDFDPDYQPGVWEPHFEELKRRGTLTFETRHRCKDGRVFPVEVNANYAIIGKEEINFALVRDITERKRSEEERRNMEARMQHAQKMESMGILAGGVAHDFNNLLTAVLGNAGLAATQVPDDSPARSLLREIEQAALRASELTQQLLAYSGRGRFIVQPVRLDELVREMSSLLQSVVSRKATIKLDLAPVTVQGDATQLRQIIMNLITNASDALGGEAGAIAIRTETRRLSPDDLRSPYLQDDLPAGAYACLTVSDTGCGMSPQTLSRMFEPFFTTKFTGRGLGLAAVLGIMRSHHGSLHVQSEIDQGTTVRLDFPVFTGDSTPTPTVEATTIAPSHGRGLALIVEDEPLVRMMIERGLESAGFKTLAVGNGQEAIALFQKHRDEITVMLVDVTMPVLDGRETAAKLAELGARQPVLMMSGYDNASGPTDAPTNVRGFLKKPFRIKELIAAVDAALGGVAG